MSHFKQGKTIYRINSTTSSGGTLTLVFNSARYQQITGTQNHTIVLPDTTTLPKGIAFIISNRGTGTVTVNFNGGSLAKSMAAGTQATFLVFDNSTSLGDWDASNEASSGGGASLSPGDKLSAIAALGNGFYKDSSSTSIAFRYNAEEIGSDSWTSKSNLITARGNGEVFELHGYGYAVAGTTGAGSDIVTSERYDDTNNFWLARASVATNREVGAGFSLNGFGYVTNGYDGSVNLNTTEQYNDTTNVWSSKATTSIAKKRPVGFSLNGYGFSHGGDQTSPTALNVLDLYNDGTNTWSPRGAVAQSPRATHGCFVLNSAAYLYGGYDSGGSNLGSAEKYNDVNNTSSVIASLSVGAKNYGYGAAMNSFGYAVAGANSTNDVEEYVEFNNTWRTKTTLITPRFQNYSIALNGQLYSCGGLDSGATTYLANTEQYKNADIFRSSIIKKSALVPSALLVSVTLNDLAVTVPVRVRTDGDTWKNLTSNVDSSLKLNEVLKAKYVPSGLGYVSGGYNGSTLANTEFYSDGPNTWSNRANLSPAKGYGAGFTLNGLAYNAGGTTNGSPGGATTDVQQYNDITNTYVSKAATSTTRAFSNGFSLLGFGYNAAGGTTNNGSATNERYDDSANAWTAKASLGTPRIYGGCFALHDRAYIAGGFTTGGGDTQVNEQYSPILDSWTAKTSLGSDHQDAPSGFSINDFGYIASGGITTNEQYNDQANSWSNKTAIGTAAKYSFSFRTGGYAYVAGGANPGYISTVARYNNASNTWDVMAGLNTARAGMTSAFTPSQYRNYEIQVGIPAYMAGIGAGIWVSRGSTPAVNSGLIQLNGYLYTASNGNQSHRYTESTNTWTLWAETANGNTSHVAGASLNGFGYGFDGFSSSASACQKFNDVTNLWSSIASTSTGRTDVQNGFALNNYAYVVGGSGPANLPLERYDDIANSWTSKATATRFGSTGSSGQGNFVLNGYNYLAGSDNSTTGVQRYNDVADTWTTVGSLNTGAFVSTFPLLGYGYAVNQSGSSTQSVERYNDASDTWSYAAPQTASGYSAVALNGSGYMANAGGNTVQFRPSITNAVIGLGLLVTES